MRMDGFLSLALPRRTNRDFTTLLITLPVRLTDRATEKRCEHDRNRRQNPTLPDGLPSIVPEGSSSSFIRTVV